MFVGDDLTAATQSTALNASAVLIGRKKSIENSLNTLHSAQQKMTVTKLDGINYTCSTGSPDVERTRPRVSCSGWLLVTGCRLWMIAVLWMECRGSHEL